MRTLQHTRIPVEHLEKRCVLSRLWVSHIEGKGKRWQMFIPGVWVLGTVFGEKGFDCARCTFRWIDASRSMRNYNLFCTEQSIQFCIDLKHTKNKTDCSIFVLFLWLKKDFRKSNSCLSLTTGIQLKYVSILGKILLTESLLSAAQHIRCYFHYYTSGWLYDILLTPF